MASTLYLQMPPRSVAEVTPSWNEHAFPFCLVSGDKRPLQHGRQNLHDLKDLAKSANQVVLLLASSDVSVFQIEVPPMPLQKLRAALPNLLEDQLLVDSSELLFVCSSPENGHCTVAVVSRLWMESLLSATQILEARKLSAFPLALSLRQEPGTISAALESVVGAENQYMLSVKSSASVGAGLSLFLAKESEGTLDIGPIFSSLDLFCSGKQVELYVESHLCSSVNEVLAKGNQQSTEYRVQPLDWSQKIAADLPPALNLFSLLVQENQSSFDWQKWRWSVALAIAITLISVLALNWEWYRLKSEATSLNDSLLATYKNLFPNERSMRDPLLQLQQRIDQAKKLAGQSTEEDFLVMSGQLAQAWQVAHPQGTQLAGLEYRERALFAKAKNSAEVQVDALRSALREYGLKLEIKDGNYKVMRDDGSGK